MFSSTLTLIVALLNLIVISGMLYLILKEIRGQKQVESKPEPSRDISDLEIIERLAKLERSSREQIEPNEPAAPKPDASLPANRISVAMEKLNRGMSAEQVGKDLGYSRSEMGIILASIRHGRTTADNAIKTL